MKRPSGVMVDRILPAWIIGRRLKGIDIDLDPGTFRIN
jgi:hypothetical protein